MSNGVQTGTIETQVPARLDRLPWSAFHWRIIIGLGTAWILDGLEVTMVGSVASRLTENGSGIDINASQIGLAAAIYVIGACLGALIFGQLTDRFGRKKLFMITLGLYLLATVLTAFSFAPWYFFLMRFFTGAGIGGEYSAVNSAIDELIPARVRGRTDLLINGSYWLGAAGGALLAVVLLNESLLPADIGWRFAFGVGAVLGLVVLVVRRHVPESPRWLFIHGQQDEAERIVDGIEHEVEQETGQSLSKPEGSLRIRQRKTIPFREIAKTAFELYPKRAVLGLALFVGQAFLYNAFTFDLGTLLSKFFGISSGNVPFYVAMYAAASFFGPLTLGRLFDTVGRKPMIAGTYLSSAIIAIPLAILFMMGSLNLWGFMALLMLLFFFTSSGASSAYLTVSEIFPMETRALAIAFFYAVGTGIGGIAGPLLFGNLIDSGSNTNVAIGFFIGAAVMAVGGIVELFFGVEAAGANLEDIAAPLTADDPGQDGGGGQSQKGGGGKDDGGKGGGGKDGGSTEHQQQARQYREDAERLRAQAAEHRATAIELQGGDGQEAGDRRAAEETLAEMADLRAQAQEQRAAAEDERGNAEQGDDQHERSAASARADAADLRARGYDEQVETMAAEHDDDGERHAALAEAADERARAREQRASAEQCLAEGDDAAEVRQAKAEMHRKWSEMHEARSMVHVARAEGHTETLHRAEQLADEAQRQALAAEQRIGVAEHRDAAEHLRGDKERTQAQQREAAERERSAAELERRVRERSARRREQQTGGLRRFRPGPGSWATGRFGALDPERTAQTDRELDQEIEILARALAEHGPTERGELAHAVGARYWGPGRFGEALGAAVDEGRARRLSRRSYGPPE